MSGSVTTTHAEPPVGTRSDAHVGSGDRAASRPKTDQADEEPVL
jgi:hypothetical protein